MKGLLSHLWRAGAGLALAAAAARGVCAPADGLVVVHDAGGTVAAAPYLERPVLSVEAKEQALARARARIADVPPSPAPGVSPVKPDPLRAGPPARIRIPGLARPVFAIGSDPASLDWLESNAAWLRASGARGFLVSAPTAEAVARMRALARRLGLALDPMPGAAVADAFGARSYPFVAEPSP